MIYALYALATWSGLITAVALPVLIAIILSDGWDDISPLGVMVFAAFPAVTFAATTAAIWWTL